MGYRSSVRRIAAAAAVPYGYTMVTATTAGVLMGTHGAPGTGDAFLFLAGAGSGFVLVSAIGGAPEADDGASAPVPADPRATGACSAVAAAAGLGGGAVMAHALDGGAAFAAGPLLATATYFLASAAGDALLARRGSARLADGPAAAARDDVV